MKHSRYLRRVRAVGFVVTCGIAFSGLSCVTKAADAVVGGATFVGSTGAFGLLSPAVVQIGSGISFVGDLVRLFR